MATPQFNLPAFSSEAEEAEWLDSHQDLISEWFATAARAGTLKSGIAAERAISTAISADESSIVIRIPQVDLVRARSIAEGRGVGYQAYLRTLIHEGLERDGSKAD